MVLIWARWVMDVPVSKFSTLLQRSSKRMGVQIPLSMEDQAESGGHCARKEIQLFIFALQENCNRPPEPSVVLPRYYRHGTVGSRYFLWSTTFSIKHHKSGMPTKQGFPYVPPQGRFSAFAAVKMSILLQPI